VWESVSLEDIGNFVAWLRLPRSARSGQVLPLPWVDGDLSAATVNRKLSAVSSFYEFHGVMALASATCLPAGGPEAAADRGGRSWLTWAISQNAAG
jgi:integrase/recombinase XerD